MRKKKFYGWWIPLVKTVHPSLIALRSSGSFDVTPHKKEKYKVFRFNLGIQTI
jgi:hypothetical protein